MCFYIDGFCIMYLCVHVLLYYCIFVFLSAHFLSIGVVEQLKSHAAPIDLEPDYDEVQDEVQDDAHEHVSVH